MEYLKARRESNKIGGSQQFDQAGEEERGLTSKEEVSDSHTIHGKGIRASYGVLRVASEFVEAVLWFWYYQISKHYGCSY